MLSSSKLSTLPKFSSTFSSLEQPERFRILRNFKPLMVLGRLSRYCQSFKLNTRPVRSSTDNGNSRIAIPSKMSIVRDFILSGNFSSFKQLESVRVLKHFNLLIVIGRLERYLQPFKFCKKGQRDIQLTLAILL